MANDFVLFLAVAAFVLTVISTGGELRLGVVNDGTLLGIGVGFSRPVVPELVKGKGN